MKRLYTLCVILLFAVTNFYATMPYWVKNPPKSDYPNEYKYAVAEGKGRSENEARINAEEQMMEQTFMAHGCNRNEIEHWLADGFRVRTEQGISYLVRDEEGTFHYFMLYIYACKPKFFKQEHFECAKKGKEKPDIAPFKKSNTRPVYWSDYDDADTYYSAQRMHFLQKGQILPNVIDSLYKVTQQNLIDKHKDYDSEVLFPPLVCNDYYYDKKKKEVHAISYVRRNSLKNVYITRISDQLSITIENEIKDAQSFEKTEDWEIASAMYKKAHDQCDETTQWVELLKKISGETPLITYYTLGINNVREVLRNSLTELRKKAAPDREKRIFDLLNIAQQAETERKLGTALKYYYGALAYMTRYQQLGEMPINYDYAALGHPWGINTTSTFTQQTLKNWLPEHIRKILKGIDIQCYQDEIDADRINFVFSWPDKSFVTDGDFCFNLNKGMGWSWPNSIKDGEGGIETRDCPKQFDVRLEYEYIEQWHSDEAIRNEVKKGIPFDFSLEATHHVVVSNTKPIHAPTMDQVALFPTTNVTMQTHKSKGNQIFEVPVSEEKVYKNIIAQVCEAINNNNYASVQHTFTTNGYKLFLQFVTEGKVTVKNATRYHLISVWDEVYARSIKMTIQFRSKKEILTKNVVFVFDKNKKIDGIQFAIDEITRQDINAQDNWDDGMKFAVMNFIENYQTAYNLKRLDYIQSVFSDDAIIIVGHVVPIPTKISDSENINNFKKGNSKTVKYFNLSKEEYMNRLKRVFASNEWININFANVNISQHPDQEAKSTYGLGLRQDYSSQHYGDTGYLFLVVDMNDQQKPIIHLRVWTPEAKFGWPQYIQLLKEEQEKK